MADDREVLREIWDARLPVQFTLHPEDVNDTLSNQPESYYLMVPRVSYLTVVTDKVNKFCMKYVDENKPNEMWFDFEGQPLKWNYPIGLLYDLLGQPKLPWNITVHFQKYPEDEIMRWLSKDDFEHYFIQTIKEASVLKDRKDIMNQMHKNDHLALRKGLMTHKFDQFWSVNRKLMTQGHNLFRNIPFRIYLKPDNGFIQRLFCPWTEEKVPADLGHLLVDSVPTEYCNSDGLLQEYKVLIQGIEVPLITPVQWLSEHFSYPDNFLHIVVAKKS